jgi:hypothetical protein
LREVGLRDGPKLVWKEARGRYPERGRRERRDVPLALPAFGQDPAQSLSIILTTITDCGGFLSFLGLATLLSGLLTDLNS